MHTPCFIIFIIIPVVEGQIRYKGAILPDITRTNWIDEKLQPTHQFGSTCSSTWLICSTGRGILFISLCYLMADLTHQPDRSYSPARLSYSSVYLILWLISFRKLNQANLSAQWSYSTACLSLWLIFFINQVIFSNRVAHRRADLIYQWLILFMSYLTADLIHQPD